MKIQPTVVREKHVVSLPYLEETDLGLSPGLRRQVMIDIMEMYILGY